MRSSVIARLYERMGVGAIDQPEHRYYTHTLHRAKTRSPFGLSFLICVAITLRLSMLRNLAPLLGALLKCIQVLGSIPAKVPYITMVMVCKSQTYLEDVHRLAPKDASACLISQDRAT